MDKSWVSLILHGFAVAPLQNSQLQGQCLSRWWYGNNYSTNLGEHSMKLTTWIANNYVQTDFKLGSECDSGLTKWDSERVVWNSSVKQTLDHLLSKKKYLGHLWEHWPVLRWSSSNGHAIFISGKLKTIPTTPWISNWQTPRTHVTFIPNVKNTFRSTTHLFCLNVGPPKCTGLTHQVLLVFKLPYIAINLWDPQCSDTPISRTMFFFADE